MSPCYAIYLLCLCLCVFVLFEVELGLFSRLSFVKTVTLVRLAYHRLLASRCPSLWHVVWLCVCTDCLGLSVCCIHQDHASCSDVALHVCLSMMVPHCISCHHCQTCQPCPWLACLVDFVACVRVLSPGCPVVDFHRALSHRHLLYSFVAI